MYDILGTKGYNHTSYGAVMHRHRGRRRAYDHAAQYTRRTWLFTLDQLQAVPTHLPGAEFKALMLKLWADHGRAYGLDEVTERRRRAAGTVPTYDTDDDADAPLMPCGWPLCLCSEHDATHRMHVCKGCLEVMYCSKKCQKKCVICWAVSPVVLVRFADDACDRDWKAGGHKDVCPGRRAQKAPHGEREQKRRVGCASWPFA